MPLLKKMLILKQITAGYSLSDKPVSAIVRAESDGGITEICVTLINFFADGKGRCRLFFIDGKGKLSCLDLPNRPQRVTFIPDPQPCLEAGVAAGICYVLDDIPQVIAFSRSDDSQTDLSAFKRAVAERLLSERKNRPKPPNNQDGGEAVTLPAPIGKGTPPEQSKSTKEKNGVAPDAIDVSVSKHIGEHVLLENPNEIASPDKESIHEGDENIESGKDDVQDFSEITEQNSTLNGTVYLGDFSGTFTPRYDDEAVATANYYDVDREIRQKIEEINKNDEQYIRVENGVPYTGIGEKADESENRANRAKNERDNDGGEQFSQERPYYLSVQGELEDLFQKFPGESSLEKLFPESRWARINYSAERYYVVGLIKEQSKEKYICYGIPAPYSEQAPQELAPYCSFVPVSLFDMKGDGFWMMFQSADTGECINLSERRNK